MTGGSETARTVTSPGMLTSTSMGPWVQLCLTRWRTMLSHFPLSCCLCCTSGWRPSQVLVGSTSSYHCCRTLAELWRDREVTDVNMLALRLQLYREVFEQPVICLCDLHPGFQGGHGDVKVFIPNDGYIPAVLQGDMTPSKFADLVMAATTHDNWLYVGTGQNGPADSWVVLFEANLCNVPTGQRVVINIQSKLRSGVQSVSCQALLNEVRKVAMLLQDRCKQAVLYVSDQLPSAELLKQFRQAQSMQPPHGSLGLQQPQLQWQLWQFNWSGRKLAAAVVREEGSMDVVLVLGDEQHLYKGGTQVIKQAVERMKKQKLGRTAGDLLS